MIEYVFCTHEGFTLNPYGEEIENCQLLGRALGKSEKEALNNLISECPWIIKNGYHPEKIFVVVSVIKAEK